MKRGACQVWCSLCLANCMTTRQHTHPRPWPAAALAIAVLSSGFFARAQAETGRPQLEAQARQWLAALTSQSTSKIALSQPDGRIRVSPCGLAWAFDLPFGPGQALRARCERPAQQVFLMTQPVKSPAIDTQVRPAPATTTNAGKAAERPQSMGWVLAQAVDARSPLSPQLLVPGEVPSDQAHDLVSAPELLQHMEVTRPFKAGSPLRKSDLRPIKLIKRGDFVTVSVAPAAGLVIRATLEATQDGTFGQSIKLKNPQSGRQTAARVTGPGQAEAI